MALQIEDGTGSGSRAEVKDNKLATISVITTEEHHANHVNETAYNVSFSQSPTASDDCIFYMINSSDIDIIVEGITLGFKNAGAVDAEVYIEIRNIGTRGSVTALTPVNLNAGSGNTASGTFEKGADLQTGGATLASGDEVERFIFANVQDLVSKHFNFNQDVILPKNQTMTIWATDATATYYVTLPFYYHDKS